MIFSLASGGAEKFIVELSNELVKSNEVFLCVVQGSDRNHDIDFFRTKLSNNVHYINLGYSKGINIQAFDVTNIEQPTDFTIVCSGTSSRHVLSLMDYVSQGVKDEFGVYPQGLEGTEDGRWVIVDYGGLMVHIFYDFIRNEYQIEDLWREGKRIEL